MRLVDMAPQDIHFLIDYSLADLKKLQIAMHHCVLENFPPEHKEAITFFQSDFFRFVSDCIESAEGGGESNGS